MKRFIIIGLVIILGLFSYSYAQEDDDFSLLKQEGKPYILNADKLEDRKISKDERLTILTGNVKVTHGDIVLTGGKAWFYRNQEKVIIRNDVVIIDEATTINCQKGIYKKNSNKLTLYGSVTIDDSVKNIKARQIDYYRDKKEIIAFGNVRLYDKENNALLTGSNLNFDRNEKYGILMGSPILKKFDDENQRNERITISSDKMEFFQKEEKAVATSNVEILHGETKATCLVATYFNKENKLMLSGNPEVTKDKNYMAGDEIHLILEDEIIKDVNIIGNAFVEYVPNDSTSYASKKSTIFGNKVLIELKDEKVKYIEIDGNAKSIYYPNQEDLVGDRNIVSGGKMSLFVENEEIQRVIIENNGTGTYRFIEEKKD